jgi:hypothetical protein
MLRSTRAFRIRPLSRGYGDGPGPHQGWLAPGVLHRNGDLTGFDLIERSERGTTADPERLNRDYGGWIAE